jgi:hypothetical protein
MFATGPWLLASTLSNLMSDTMRLHSMAAAQCSTRSATMKPVEVDRRTGELTIEQYVGLADGMSFKVAGRMLTLAGDYTNDVIGLREDALDPRRDRGSLTGLARAATRAETHLAQVLALAAEHCRDTELADVALAIRSNMKTVSRCRSAVCRLAMTAERHGHGEQLAA